MKKTWQKWAVAFVATFGLSNVALADDAMESYKEAIAEADSYCENHRDSKPCSIYDNEKELNNLCNSKSNTQESAFACLFASLKAASSNNSKMVYSYAYKACEKRMANPSISKKLSAGCFFNMTSYMAAVENGETDVTINTGANFCKNKNDAYFKKFIRSLADVNPKLGNIPVKTLRGLCSPYRELTKR